ncbi:MAG: hypothetical protein LBQ48_06450 [Oscillospiraceae bacterium]|nr:hypothetical protein [Oscillospiraceae bacterium]
MSISETILAFASETPAESGAEESGLTDTVVSDDSTEQPTQSASSTPAQASGNSNKTQSTASKPTTPPATSQPPTETLSKPPTPANAKPTDAVLIADKILVYINQYRVEQGTGAATKLPKLTRVAQYRSGQLVADYKHDNIALQEAATAHEYGKHVVIEETRWDAQTQSIIKTGKILDYYEAPCGEAIGRSGGNASVDEIAQRMATGFKNSTEGHWSFVGAAKSKYIAVGATFGNGQWYIAILMCEVNTYG